VLSAPLYPGEAQTEVPPQTSGAAGTILFHDDFSKPANSWTVAKTDYAEFGYSEGEYRIHLTKPDFNTYSILPTQKFDNVSVEVDARLASGAANGVFGILCRAQANENTASKAYIFAIRADGFFAVLKRTSPTFWDAIASAAARRRSSPATRPIVCAPIAPAASLPSTSTARSYWRRQILHSRVASWAWL
jgi:hypothetical protein